MKNKELPLLIGFFVFMLLLISYTAVGALETEEQARQQTILNHEIWLQANQNKE